MRKFQTFAALMPGKLVEAHAHILNDRGEHCSGDNVEFSRFGYAIQWCDGSGVARYSRDETIETAIKDATEYLTKHHWKLGTIEYTGQDITPDIIDKFTTVVASEDDTINGFIEFFRLKIACFRQPWFEMVRNKMGSYIGVYNIGCLPESVRSRDYELVSCNENGEILIKTGYTFDDEGDIRGYTASWKTVPEVREELGLPDDASNIDVVNAVVDNIVFYYTHHTDAVRERKAKFLDKFREACKLFEHVITSCSEGRQDEVLPDLARLQEYARLLEGNDRRFSRNVLTRFTGTSPVIDLTIDFMMFDWTTCVIDRPADDIGCVHGKVKVKDDVYSSVRSMYREEYPDAVKRQDDILENVDRLSQGKRRTCSSWRDNTRDAQWFHFRYGVTQMGNAVFAGAYGPETLDADTQSNLDYVPPESYGDAEYCSVDEA